MIDMPDIQHNTVGGLHSLTRKVTPAPNSSPSPALVSKYGYFWLQKLKMATSCKLKSMFLKGPFTNQWTSWGVELASLTCAAAHVAKKPIKDYDQLSLLAGSLLTVGKVKGHTTTTQLRNGNVNATTSSRTNRNCVNDL